MLVEKLVIVVFPIKDVIENHLGKEQIKSKDAIRAQENVETTNVIKRRKLSMRKTIEPNFRYFLCNIIFSKII